MKNPDKPVLLLDADVICHKVAYACTTHFDFGDGEVATHLRPDEAKSRIDSEIESLIRKFNASELVVCLSTRTGNFRKDIAPYYKSKRSPKPELWETTRSYLESEQTEYRTAVYPRLEGDDVLGILHTGAHKGTSVMVTIDKDLRGVPGFCYFTNKDRGIEAITPRQAALFHLSQVITGDSTDCYPGLPGAGPARWTKIAAEWDGKSIAGLWELIVKAYEQKKLTEKDAVIQARLAFILQDGFYHHKSAKVIEWEPKFYQDL